MNRVLIVDDAAFMRMALKTILEKNGFEVIAEAENGESGVRKYIECQPDIVTMDITMPGMDGIEALKSIKAYDAKAKIIIVSAVGKESMIKQAVMSGANYFIVKPFKEDHVVEILHKMLSV
ncbi:response regulator [Petroclostridium sp. X23]|uniref:response regulator n=1 Tax=Petroclostridium sp. X23 TaxID=3045146 RepID=UPI0024AE51A2|nr:response regulator [Petroclostridium sp. X23]WHH61665.1 response regulator [Petroclostridium sp. X23]